MRIIAALCMALAIALSANLASAETINDCLSACTGQYKGPLTDAYDRCFSAAAKTPGADMNKCNIARKTANDQCEGTCNQRMKDAKAAKCPAGSSAILAEIRVAKEKCSTQACKVDIESKYVPNFAACNGAL